MAQVPTSDLPSSSAVPASDTPTGAVPASDLPQPNARGTAAPSPDLLPNLRPFVQKYAKEFGVDPIAMETQIGIESAGGRNPGVSSAGAEGVSQFMGPTAAQYGVTDRNNPEQSIRGMAQYMRDLVKHYKGDYHLAAMAYNAGPGAVDSYLAGKGGLASETFSYGSGFVEGYDRRKKLASQVAQPASSGLGHITAGRIDEAGILPPGTAKTLLGRKSALREGAHMAIDSAHNSALLTGMQYINAVLGAPQRLVMGATNANGEAQDANGGKPFFNIGATGHEILRGFGVAFHPNDQRMQEKESHEQVRRVLHSFGIHAASKGPLEALEMFGVQVATDPLTYVPVLGELGIGGKVLKALSDAHDALPEGHVVQQFTKELAARSQAMSQNQLVQNAQWLLRVRPELDAFVDRTGKAARLGIESRYANQFQALRQADEALLKMHGEALKTAEKLGDLPKEVAADLQRRTRFESWAFGTPEMRAAAVREGFKPSAAEEKLFPDPVGALKYTHIADYEPLIRTFAEKAAARAEEGLPELSAMAKEMFRRYGDKGRAAFERERKGGNTTTSLLERFTDRLSMGRTYAQRRLVDAETEAFFRAHPEHAKDGFKTELLSHDAETPGSMSHIMGAVEQLGRPFRLLQNASVLGNPLPHGFKNVGELSYLAGGAPTFFRGLMHAVTGAAGSSGMWRREATDIESAKILDRMEGLGLSTNYSHEANQGLFRVPGFRELGKGGQVVLERLENGFRAAALEQADKLLGPSRTMADEYRKAEFVRNHLGDYRNVNGIVQMFRTFGGPFVAFRLGIAPAAFLRATVRNPGRAVSIPRAQDDFNNSHTLPPGVSFGLGGSIDDAGKLLNPTTTGDFLMSPSTLGFAGDYLLYSKQIHDGKIRPLGALALSARDNIPGVGLGMTAAAPFGFDPYSQDMHPPKGVSPLGLALTAAIGSYFRNQSGKAAKAVRATDKRQDKNIDQDFDTLQKALKKIGL